MQKSNRVTTLMSWDIPLSCVIPHETRRKKGWVRHSIVDCLRTNKQSLLPQIRHLVFHSDELPSVGSAIQIRTRIPGARWDVLCLSGELGYNLNFKKFKESERMCVCVFHAETFLSNFIVLVGDTAILNYNYLILCLSRSFLLMHLSGFFFIFTRFFFENLAKIKGWLPLENLGSTSLHIIFLRLCFTKWF